MTIPPPIAAKAAGPDCLRCKVPIRERHPAFIELCMNCGGIAAVAKHGKPDAPCNHHPVLTRERGYVCQFCGVAVAIVPVGALEGAKRALDYAITLLRHDRDASPQWVAGNIETMRAALAALSAKADAGVQ